MAVNAELVNRPARFRAHPLAGRPFVIILEITLALIAATGTRDWISPKLVFGGYQPIRIHNMTRATRNNIIVAMRMLRNVAPPPKLFVSRLPKRLGKAATRGTGN